MASVTANEAVLAVLGSVRELTEVREANGKVIGFYAPIAIENAQHYANAAAHIDPAEIRQRSQSKEECVPFETIRGWLGMLEAEMGRRKAAGEKEFTTEEAMAYYRSIRQPSTTSTPYPGKAEGALETERCPTP